MKKVNLELGNTKILKFFCDSSAIDEMTQSTLYDTKILFMVSDNNSTTVKLSKVGIKPKTAADIEKQMNNNDSVVAPTATLQVQDPHGTLEWHVGLNLGHFDGRFRGCSVDPMSGMLMYPCGKRFVFSSSVDRYYYLHPALYRTNCAIRDIEFAELMQKLGTYNSLIPREAYEAVLASWCLPSYADLFASDIRAEATQRGRLHSLFTAMLHRINTAQPLSLRVNCEVLSAAAGHVAKHLEEDPRKIDHRAGIAGKCDAVVNWGEVKDEDSSTLCAVELKYVDRPLQEVEKDLRWFTHTDALLPQTVQSHIGLDSLLSIAMCEHGFKVYLKEEVKNEKELNAEEKAQAAEVNGKWIRIYSWPPNHKFFIPDQFDQVDEGLRVLAEVARLATAKATPQPRKRKVEEPESPENRKKTATRDELPTEESKPRKNPPRAVASRGAKTSLTKTSCGRTMVLRSIDLHAHYTEEEIGQFVLNEELSWETNPAIGA